MNASTKLDGLSYKELQALALKYKVPKNMRKHLLIRLLEAKKVGNNVEVNKIIHEQCQNRKKRIKKSNKQLEKDYSRNVSQAQWMFNADREVEKMTGGIIDRYEDRSQISNYPQLNQFVRGGKRGGGGGGGGVKRNHDNVIGNNNERSQSPAIVDLRMNPRRISELDEYTADMHEKKRFLIQFNHHDASVIDYKSYNNDIDTSQQLIQYGSPRLLKKMLQAPVGVNLKQLVSYEDSYNITPISHDIYDDSDTLTAESDSCINNNHVDFSNYYQNDNTQNIIKSCANYTHHHHHTATEYYGLNENSSSDVIENCQKWLANSSYNDNNHSTDIVDNNNYYNPEQIHHSYEIKSCDNPLYYDTENNVNQCEYLHQHQHLEAMEQAVDDGGNVEAVDIEQQFCDNNQWTPTVYTYLQENRENFYDSHIAASDNAELLQYEQVDIKMGNYHNNQDHQRYSQYTIKHDYEKREGGGGGDFDGRVAEMSIQEPLDQMYYGTNFTSNELDSSIPGNIMNCYWPQWPYSCGSKLEKSKINYKLENLLNLDLNTSYQVEQIKSDQTSCVYCYTTPIVTQRIFSSFSTSSSFSSNPSPSVPKGISTVSNIHQVSSLSTHCLNHNDNDDYTNPLYATTTTTITTTTDLSLQSQKLWACTIDKNSTTPNSHVNATNADQSIYGNLWMSDYV